MCTHQQTALSLAAASALEVHAAQALRAQQHGTAAAGDSEDAQVQAAAAAESLAVQAAQVGQAAGSSTAVAAGAGVGGVQAKDTSDHRMCTFFYWCVRAQPKCFLRKALPP
jgi:hypothetical protein